MKKKSISSNSGQWPAAKNLFSNFREYLITRLTLSAERRTCFYHKLTHEKYKKLIIRYYAWWLVLLLIEKESIEIFLRYTTLQIHLY